MSGANGTKVPNASQRARAAERQAGKDEANLAAVFGQVLAQVLAQVLPQALAQMRQPTGCAVCAIGRKRAELAHVVAAANAQAAAEPEPGAPPLPDVQEAFTTAPFALRPDLPAWPLPLCYDHLPVDAVQAGLPPVQRDTGLVTAAGQPIVAQSR